MQRSTRSQGSSNSTHRVEFSRGQSPKARGAPDSLHGEPTPTPTQPPTAGTVPASLASWEGPFERWARAESNNNFDFVSGNDQRDRRASATAHTRSGSNGDCPRKARRDRNSEHGEPPLMPTQPPVAGTVPASLAFWKGPVERGPRQKVTTISILSAATIIAIPRVQQQHTPGPVPTGTVPESPARPEFRTQRAAAVANTTPGRGDCPRISGLVEKTV